MAATRVSPAVASVTTPTCCEGESNITLLFHYVFLGLKAHSYPTTGPLATPLLGERTGLEARQKCLP
ncbi:hypothetical protein [Streptomyces sp. NPDC092129]|uniref:hypothetical protein n=1 Tax=Streptomyces sp. NPDC092129 TaxID=3366010 RepID=UPI00381D7716